MLDIRTSGDGMDETSRATVVLVPVEGGTRLDLTVEGLSGAEAADNMRVGWTWCLEGIAEQLDTAA